ncbi:MAG: hypothetical protein AAGB34_03820, partial [Planctomycetota bacterium]
ANKLDVVYEFDISSLNASQIQYATISGYIELRNNVEDLPMDFAFKLYDANGLVDTTDVTNTVSTLGTVTFSDPLHAFYQFDITDALKDEINAGEDYIGLRVEPVSSDAWGVLTSYNAGLAHAVTIAIYTQSGNFDPDPSAPDGGPTVDKLGNTLRFRGTNGNDVLIVDKSGSNVRFRNNSGTTYGTFPESQATNIRIDLYDGNDTASIYNSVNLPATVYGGGGNDIINGSKKNDILYGGNGDDRLTGNNGNDRLYGGDGDDILKGSNGDDSLFGGFRTDTLEGNAGSDRFLVRAEVPNEIVDFGSTDVVVPFIGYREGTHSGRTHERGFWTDSQIQRIDEVFDMWLQYFGTHALHETLTEINDQLWFVPVAMGAYGEVTSGSGTPLASASDARINHYQSYFNGNASYTDFEWLADTATHEMAHIHDRYTSEQRWTEHRQWVRNPTSTNNLFLPNGSQNGYYRQNGGEDGISQYGNTNNIEDLAECFMHYVLTEIDHPKVNLRASHYVWPSGLTQAKNQTRDFADYFAGDNYQAVIWYEDFLGLANGTRSDSTFATPGSNWTVDESNDGVASSTFGVDASYEFDLGRTEDTANQNGYAVWESEEIEIWQYTNVAVSFDLKGTQDMESSGAWQDYFSAYAVVDGIAVPLLSIPGNASSSFTTQFFSGPTFTNKDTLRLRFVWKTTGETYTVDNIYVTGNSTPSDIGDLGDNTANGGNFDFGTDLFIEAEDFTGTFTGQRSWDEITSGGVTFLRATGTGFNSGENLTGESKTYTFYVPESGTYYVSARMRQGPGGASDDSVHIGYRKTGSDPYSIITLGASGLEAGGSGWQWADTVNSQRITMNLNSPGKWALRMWIREDGVEVDEILISDSP